jgi:hypothetical protein
VLELEYGGINIQSRPVEIQDSFWEYLSDFQKQRFHEQQKKLQGMITVRQNEQTIRVSADGNQGLAAAAGSGQGYGEYEFKIPLNSSQNLPYSINTKPGESIRMMITLSGRTRPDFQPERPGPSGTGTGKWSGKTQDENLQLEVVLLLANPVQTEL